MRWHQGNLGADGVTGPPESAAQFEHDPAPFAEPGRARPVVLTGVDGSRSGQVALAVAARQAATLGAELVGVHVPPAVPWLWSLSPGLIAQFPGSAGGDGRRDPASLAAPLPRPPAGRDMRPSGAHRGAQAAGPVRDAAVTPLGLSAWEQLYELLLSMLSAAAVAGAGLLCLGAAGYGLTAAASRLRRRRRARHADARLHAEAERGIEDLERYLGRRRDTTR